jgi:molecular chaperone Hsp33
MALNDHWLIATSAELNVRVVCVDSTQLCEEARRRHETKPLATVALSRALTGALLMGSSLKGKQRVGLQYRGSGPLKEIYADADGEGNVRGYALNPGADIPLREGRFDIAGGLGAGILSVTTDLGLRDTYQGVVALESGEMAADLANYLYKSAQIPSIVNFGVWLNENESVGAAGGFLVQALPGAKDEILEDLEGNVLGLPPLSTMVRDGMSPEEILGRIMHGYRYEILATGEVHYSCRCSRDRVERTLIALGSNELRDMATENHGAEVKCEFCGERYSFTETELIDLVERAQEPN